jgi:hypothetical protein
VDRIGQTRTVHEILLVAGDTAERLVLAPLARRAAGARYSTAGASQFFSSLTESRIAAAVLAGEQVRANDTSGQRPAEQADRLTLRNEATAEMHRVAARRRWRAQSSGVRTAADSKMTTSRRR